jgi:hypothetical protein
MDAIARMLHVSKTTIYDTLKKTAGQPAAVSARPALPQARRGVRWTSCAFRGGATSGCGPRFRATPGRYWLLSSGDRKVGPHRRVMGQPAPRVAAPPRVHRWLRRVCLVLLGLAAPGCAKVRRRDCHGRGGQQQFAPSLRLAGTPLLGTGARPGPAGVASEPGCGRPQSRHGQAPTKTPTTTRNNASSTKMGRCGFALTALACTVAYGAAGSPTAKTMPSSAYRFPRTKSATDQTSPTTATGRA